MLTVVASLCLSRSSSLSQALQSVTVDIVKVIHDAIQVLQLPDDAVDAEGKKNNALEELLVRTHPPHTHTRTDASPPHTHTRTDAYPHRTHTHVHDSMLLPFYREPFITRTIERTRVVVRVKRGHGPVTPGRPEKALLV